MNRNCPKILAVVGFVLLLTGIIFYVYAFPSLIAYGISKAGALVEGNEVFEMWKEPPFPLKLNVYFFNVNNAEDVQQGAKPILKEIGPYVFDEYWIKENVTVNETEDTISYMLKRKFYFNPKDTGCRSENDLVTLINGAFVSSALYVATMMPAMMDTINDAVPYLYKGIKDVFLRTSIKDILFDGILITCHDPEIAFMCGAMKTMLPPIMDFVNNGTDVKFSLFGYLNKTISGPFKIGRGIKNTTKGELMAYKGKDKMEVWAGPTCNMINGSDSALFAPFKEPPEKLYAFSHDVCRSIFLSYEKPIVYKGIRAFKYSNKPESLTDNGPDECFCPRVKDDDYEDVPECPKPGLLNVAPCLQAPLLASFPHFYQAHPSLLRYARGLKPEKELHESYIYIEPMTGAPIDGAIRLQINAELKRFEDIDLLNNVSQGVCPMLWVEQVKMALLFIKLTSLTNLLLIPDCADA
ncbi:hypothetical protein ILUMI_04802 [Ignelater luminosus]|uniref:Sensory neuron membrane protein 1 n=1 Tax=Ignelater luminosus TaxID=2038154 RepID=A0A8K0DD58_IGNLU|nr:hypothetical protein ILUMI_04802 [Ignelater luminosus]